MKPHVVRQVIWIAAVTSFLSCLVFTPFYVDDKAYDSGLGLLLMGWLGLFDMKFSWMANPLFLISLVMFMLHRYRLAAVLGWVGLAFALSFQIHSRILTSEAPTYGTITGYGIGYVLWVVSIAALALGSLWMLRSTKQFRS